MARIIVNHQTLKTAADKLDEKNRNIKTVMGNANSVVDGGLHTNWDGMDYTQFRIEWQNKTKKATTDVTKKLEEHANFLRFAASKYNQAQTDAVNKANSIPQW